MDTDISEITCNLLAGILIPKGASVVLTDVYADV